MNLRPAWTVRRPGLLLVRQNEEYLFGFFADKAASDLMEKLTKHGQAILCTIHQPSAMLFQRFDRLLFLAKGGKTVCMSNSPRG